MSDDIEFNNTSGMKLEDVTPKLPKMWWNYKNLSLLNFFLIGSILSQVTSGYDGSMMNNLQTLKPWQEYFDNPSGAILGTMNNGVTVGTLISIPFAWYIIDYIGRKKSIIMGCMFVIVGAILQGCAQNFGMFVGGRILLGVGSCLSSAAAGPLIAETAFPSERPVINAMLLNTWGFGSLLAGVVTIGPYFGSMRFDNWSWRLPSLLQMALPAIQMVIVFFGPESPRWLVSKGREEEARQILIKYHGFGDADSPLVKFEMAEITASLSKEGVKLKDSFRLWRKSPRRTFIVFALPAMQQLCGNALTAYYLNTILESLGFHSTLEKLRISIGMSAYATAVGVAGSVCVGLLKRRFIFLFGYLSQGFAFILWTILSSLNEQRNFKDKGLGIGVVAMIYLHSGFNGFYAPCGMAYATEICPYILRAQGATIYQLTGNIAGLFNNYVNPIGLDNIGWKYYIVWCIWLFVQAAIAYFFFPETFGLGLEEISKKFGEEDITLYMDYNLGPTVHSENEKFESIVEKTDFEHKEKASTIQVI